jgi:hypothetical protein
MSGIDAVTGQARAIRELLGWVSSPRRFVQLTAMLSGPSGSGKTWVAQQLAEVVPEEVTCVFASGDRGNASRPYAPFSEAMLSVRRRSFLAEAIPQVARMVPHVGGFMHFLLDYMLTRREAEQARTAFLLDETDREILLRLERLVGSGRLLLILDDLQWWDDKSIVLVQLMLSGQVNDLFPFTKDAVYLALTTPGQIAVASAYDSLRERFTPFEVSVSYCDEQDFGAVLLGLGLRNALPGKVARDLYEITRGHLAVARLLVDNLNQSADVEEFLGEKDFERFCERVVESRLRSAGAEVPALRDILSQAAVIGLSFTQKELECIAQEHARQLLKCVRAAKQLRLFDEHGATLTFIHELYPRVLKTRDPDESRELNRRFAVCLLRIRPADYWARARHQYDAGDLSAAHVTEIHGALAEVRDGRVGQLSREYPVESIHESLHRFHGEISAMYLAYQAAQYADVIRMAEFVEPTLPSSLRAETDYLVALCKTKSLSHSERESAAKLLERWWSMLEVEPELWSRLALARIITLGQMGDRLAMDSVARELIEQLERHVDYDSGARRIYARLALRADLLYHPEVAERRLADAVKYFGPFAAGIAARDPLCYYLALVNLTGNQIALSKYASAQEAASRCEAYIQAVQGTIDAIRFPRLDVLANNSAMSAYRAGIVSAAGAAELMRSAIEATPRSNDLPLLESNWVGYATIAGTAHDLWTLESWFERLFGGDYEPYYTFFVGNNLAASYLARGDLDLARKRWRDVASIIGRLDDRVRAQMASRQARLDSALRSEDCTFDACEGAIRSHVEDALGRAWDHYSHVVLLSELQIWSDG